MLETISTDKLLARPIDLWDNTWLLLTSGDFEAGHYNTMTVSWGGMGCMWNRPFAMVVVRPQRYTYEFMEKYDSFTLSVFSDKLRPALNLLGSRSGRRGNKIGDSGLTPVKSRQVAAPAFAEAELVMECRKIYWHDYDPSHFLDPLIDRNYPSKDYHRMYFGEILTAYGIKAYSA